MTNKYTEKYEEPILVDSSITNIKRPKIIWREVNTEKYEEQLEMLEELWTFGYNIINCGICSSVNIVRTAKELFTCYDCSETLEHHDCSDFFY